MAAYPNPYYNQTFFGFIGTFLQRVLELFTGHLPFAELASDEIQVFVLGSIATSAALLGCLLILRRMAMLANAISHTLLIGVVIAYLIEKGSTSPQELLHEGGFSIQTMILASLLTGVLTAFLTHFLTRVTQLQEDASIGLVFTSLFALGIILVTLLTRDAHIGTEAVMGNVDALHPHDLWYSLILLGINTGLFFLFFKQFLITTFDPSLARALGFSTFFFDVLLMLQTSGTVVGGFRAVGVIMVLAFMTGPPLIARMWTHRLKTLLSFAVGLGALSSLIGVALSRHLLTVYGTPFSTGSLVICVILGFFLVSAAAVPERGLIAQLRKKPALLHK